jgi:hypothetical protein
MITKHNPPGGESQGADKSYDGSGSSIPSPANIEAACTAYVVLLIIPRDTILRKPYMSLHSAQQALQRAQDRGQLAHLVLCKLEPAAADIDIDGGDRR